MTWKTAEKWKRGRQRERDGGTEGEMWEEGGGKKRKEQVVEEEKRERRRERERERRVEKVVLCIESVQLVPGGLSHMR